MKKNRVETRDRFRVMLLAIGTFFCFALLIIQFYHIQVIEGKKWTKKAEAQHRIVVTEPFERGRFYSNTSIKLGHPELEQPFVVDVPKFHLFIDPASIKTLYKDAMCEELMDLVNLATDKEKAFRENFYKQSRSRKLIKWLDHASRDAIQKWWAQFRKGKKIASNALFFVRDYQRSYPFGKMLGQVLHTIRDTKDAHTKQGIPTGGLEFYFNNQLKGKQGKRWLLRSPRNPLESGKVLSPPENGADIYLSINHYLQAIAEDEIMKGVKKVHAKAGWAVMMDPITGDILALAQYPSFNPEDYHQFYNDPLLLEHTRVKGINDAFEPGSTIKPLTLALALKANTVLEAQGKEAIFDPLVNMPTSNGWLPGRTKPLKDTHPHDYLNMYAALQRSSNIYVATLIHQVVDNLGSVWYRDALRDTFGFSKATQIELPSEHLGMLPDPGKRYANGALQWSGPTPASLAIGHNLLVNSIQLVRAYAALANGGYLVQPTLVRKILRRNSDGSQAVLLDHTRPERVKQFPRVLDKTIVKQVVTAMKYVTKKGGTATKADIGGYTEAGKTGTANKITNGVYSKKKYFSSFIGFTPVEHPRFVLFVGIDEPTTTFIPGVGSLYYGSKSAAPVFRDIAKRALEYLGITPDDPYGYPVGDPRRQATKADWTEEVQNLEKLLSKTQKKGKR